MAYNTKCTHDNASNNLEIVKKLANVRMEIAQLLGYDNFAEYNLQERMAQNSESVYKLLDQLLELTRLPPNKNMQKCKPWHAKRKEKTSS